MTDPKLYQDTVSDLLSALGTCMGTDFLDQLVISLCEISGADAALVGLVDESKPPRLHTISFCKGGEISENITYRLCDTPCDEVISGAAVSIRSKLQEHFPNKELYRSLDAESYIGVPLAFPDGDILGLVALLSRKQLIDDNFVIEIVQSFAGRTVAEIERIHFESDLLSIQQQLEKRVARESAALERANKELEAFNYSVSHDLRAPLRSIIGFTEALYEDCAEQLDDTARDHLRRISKNAKHMDELINGLLILSRVTRQPIRYSTVNLSELAADILQQLKENQPHRKVSARIQSDVIASGDPDLLRIVIQNLLANAWKFTGNTASAEISFSAHSENGNTVYQIKDNGAGFNMAFAGKLFEVFQRLHRKQDFDGIGVGLATVKRIIDRHGGSVRARSQEGKGATFYFTLPEEPLVEITS